MDSNGTCIGLNNSTSACPSASQSTIWLAVCFPLLLVALVVIPVAVKRGYSRRRSSVVLFQQQENRKIDPDHNTKKESQYSGYAGSPQPSPLTPIYENVQNRAYNFCTNQHSTTSEVDIDRSSAVPEDLYIECDSSHDAIYNNDPSFWTLTQPQDSI